MLAVYAAEALLLAFALKLKVAAAGREAGGRRTVRSGLGTAGCAIELMQHMQWCRELFQLPTCSCRDAAATWTCADQLVKHSQSGHTCAVPTLAGKCLIHQHILMHTQVRGCGLRRAGFRLPGGMPTAARRLYPSVQPSAPEGAPLSTQGLLELHPHSRCA